jgi:predicted ATP-grasp superfamily ATP-dependent carboligase
VPAPNADPGGFARALGRIARDEGVDLIVPTCEEVFWVARGLSELPPTCRALVGDPDLLVEVHDKGRFIERCAAIGLDVPATVRLGSADALWAWARQAPAPLVLKPCFSRFGTQVRIVPEADRDTLRPDRSTVDVGPDRAWVGQAFVDGAQVATWGLAHRGRLLAHAAYAMGWRVGRAAVVFEPDRDPRIRAFVERFVAETAFSGQIAFDLVVTRDGRVVPLECNPRATSGLHLLDPAAVVGAMLDPDAVRETLEARPGASAALTIPLVLQGWREAPSLGAWARAVLGARDVVFAWDDPAPSVASIRVLLAFGAMARRAGIPLVDATTLDIAFDGRPGEASCARS